jgi:uncharacterized membrane protein YphA (DoxX/SURF4 family)
MTTVLILGKILFAGYFIYSGLNHLFSIEGMTGYAKSRNLPAAKASVIVSGFWILLGGIGVLFGLYTKWALGMIGLFLLATSFFMHNFWSDADPNMKMGNMVNFGKNMALLGACLMMIATI